ncbi:hypothetical protein [Caulobacter mirabilis]|uniref:Uncharacterized protein n=1 Tax=Caulobacter mirabilis TaxID=69666 RepID=A0A2D2AXA8_9CAUL|nr:hypothetical protein [Caulobacter mirabilis]ATQ42636.1 hypothetical protein CSW64_09555 [Caulobacter mirabilis]
MRISSTIAYVLAAALLAGNIGYALGAGTFDAVRMLLPLAVSLAILGGGLLLARRWSRKHGGEIG